MGGPRIARVTGGLDKANFRGGTSAEISNKVASNYDGRRVFNRSRGLLKPQPSNKQRQGGGALCLEAAGGVSIRDDSLENMSAVTIHKSKTSAGRLGGHTIGWVATRGANWGPCSNQSNIQLFTPSPLLPPRLPFSSSVSPLPRPRLFDWFSLLAPLYRPGDHLDDFCHLHINPHLEQHQMKTSWPRPKKD